MKVAIVGFGIQGRKRLRFLKKKELSCIVDPKYNKADYKFIKNVPITSYDTAFICSPDKEKKNIVKYLISQNKNIILEKPFYLDDLKEFSKYENEIQKRKILFYTAYNHRFEKGILKLKKLLNKNILGKIYSCTFSYGNGTVKDVNKSIWRRNTNGVIDDLYPHIFDTIFYIFKIRPTIFKPLFSQKLKKEGNCYDLANSFFKYKKINFFISASYLSWKNNMIINITGSKGSLIMNSLKKWGNCNIILNQRVLPSGIPKKKVFYFKGKDYTWRDEINFIRKSFNKNNLSYLSKDKIIMSNIKNFVK